MSTSEPAQDPPMGQPPAVSVEKQPTEPNSRPVSYWRRRSRIGLALTLSGLLIFLIGSRPSMFGIDRSPIIGFVQIAVFLIGLAIICIGGYISLTSLWSGQPTSIAADIGLRLVATGYVIAVFAGMADIFGFGSHPLPKLPFFGPWQARGVEAGQALIAIGFLLLVPYRQHEKRARKLGK
jgi:hypothetical protein